MSDSFFHHVPTVFHMRVELGCKEQAAATPGLEQHSALIAEACSWGSAELYQNAIICIS